MTIRSWDFEVAPAGTTLTTANVVASDGTAATVAGITAGTGTLRSSTTGARTGTYAAEYALGASSSAVLRTPCTAHDAGASRLYHQAASAPPGPVAILAMRRSNGSNFRIGFGGTGNSRIIIQNASNATVATSTAAVTFGQQNRIEVTYSRTTGAATVNVYAGDSTTAYVTVTATGADLGTAGQYVASDIGTVSPVGAWTHYIDAFAVNDGATTESGPPSVAAAGTADLSGSGSLAATGSPATSGTAQLAGSGSLTASGSPAAATVAAFTGSGTLAASGTPTAQGAATLTGAGSLSASGTASEAAGGVANFGGTGTLAATGHPTVTAPAVFAGAGGLIAVGSATEAGSANAGLSGTGALAATGRASLDGGAALAGAGTLAATGRATIAAAAAFAGAGTLTAEGLPALAAAAQLAGLGTLTAAGSGSSEGDGTAVPRGRLALTMPTTGLTVTIPATRLEIIA